MSKYWTKTHSFVSGAARNAETCYFAVTQDNLSIDEIQHTVFIGIVGPQWYQLTHVNWKAVEVIFITKPSDLAIAMSEDGRLWTFIGGVEIPEKFEHTPKLIRGLKSIKGKAYAFGMNREVYLRTEKDKWIEMHAPKPPQSNEIFGFEAIDGYDTNNIYAVGWETEIYYFNGSEWKNCENPANGILYGVHCAPDTYVYVCGQSGLLMKGHNDIWEIISDEKMTEDIWDVIYFDNQIYAASKLGIYKITEYGLEAIILGSDSIQSAGRFTVMNDVLWSIGEKDIFTFDGNSWLRVE